MMQNSDFPNTEDGNVGNIRSDRKRDATEPKEKFLFRESVVLTSIVCLSLFNALSMYLRPKNLPEYPEEVLAVFTISTSAVAAIGVLFTAFISEVTGRKPVYLYLFSLSLISFILLLSSKQPIVIGLIYIIDGLIRGGCSVMGCLAISEYSSPKHRFAWMLVNVAAFNILSNKSFLELQSEVYIYVLIVIQIVLGLICLGSLWVWPESPYWLASKGELEQSRKAFMWLRGKEGREELASILKARSRPGPPKLFWVSLFIALATISVSTFSSINLLYSSSFFYFIRSDAREAEIYIYFFGTSAITCILVVMSYFVKRKLLFIVVSIISFSLSYAETICCYLASSKDLNGILFYLLFNASCVLQTCGPSIFGIILYIEIAPYKYNTTISCICCSVFFSSFTPLYHLSIYLFHEVSFHPCLILALLTTFSLIAALLYYFFAPETKDKTLLEIQRSYVSDENDSIPEQNQSMTLNAI